MGLYFKAEDIFGLTYDPVCEDKGIMELRYFLERDPNNIWLTLLWIPIGCAAGCIDHLLVHIWTNFEKFRKRRNTLIHPLVFSGWLLFTFLSLISLLQFGRAQISYIMKFIHVALELTNVIIFLYAWGLSGHALIVGMLATLGVFSTFSMPCTVMYDLTAIGAILDSFNFFICLLQFEKSNLFLAQTFSFFFHATYIWSFLAMAYLAETENQVLLFRIYGVFANSMAIYIGTIAMDIFTDGIDFSRKIVKKEEEYVEKDTFLFSSNKKEYIYPSRGVEINLSSLKNRTLFVLSLFTPGIFNISTNEEGNKMIGSLFLKFKRIIPITWTANAYLIKSSDIRISKMIWWSLFMTLLHYFTNMNENFTFVFLVLWFIPTISISLLFYLIWII